MGVRAAVLGASGFGGTELLRILARHRGIQVVAAAGASRTGTPVSMLVRGSEVYKGMIFVSIDEGMSADSDVVFCSLPTGMSRDVLTRISGRKVVDLGGDFRVEWVYGLPELHRDEIRDSDRVANPGCYAAAVLLALAPLAESHLIRPGTVRISAVSGVSGAGRGGGERVDFVSVNENVRPYAPLGHPHVAEMERELQRQGGDEMKLVFTPHLVPMTRGILATCTAAVTPGAGEGELREALLQRYSSEPFVELLGPGGLPETKRLTGTNRAEIAVRFDERTKTAIVLSAIDNLGKGAAGQAVQNANLMLGFEETAGLEPPALLP